MPTSVSDALGSRSITYTDEGLIDEESSGVGPVVHHQYDTLLRPSGAQVKSGGTTMTEFGIQYEPESPRVGKIMMAGHTAEYAYHPDSSLVHTLAYENTGSPVLTVTRQYDNLNRLTSIQNGTMSHDYQYNGAGQRIRMDREDGSHWLFGYDDLGQVTSATRHWSGGEPVEGVTAQILIVFLAGLRFPIRYAHSPTAGL